MKQSKHGTEGLVNRMSEHINKADILGFIREMERSRYLKNDSVITDAVLSTTECIKKFVSTMPSADVQPVVRCKDCKWFYEDRWCARYLKSFLPDDFCSYGKRKGADNV